MAISGSKNSKMICSLPHLAPNSSAEVLPANTEGEDDACRKVDMIVHSADLGLSDKFIRPESFNAYQCKGRCSLSQPEKWVLHSLVMRFLKEKKGTKTDGQACCIPTKMRPMTFINYVGNHGSFVMRTFKNMIVEECGCY